MAWVDLKTGNEQTLKTISVTINTETPFNQLAELLKQQLINNGANQLWAVEFLSFKDGRGFSFAQHLRRLGYAGQLVALGHVIPDQAQFLFRSGFDLAEMGTKKLEDWQQAIKQFSIFYQHAIRS